MDRAEGSALNPHRPPRTSFQAGDRTRGLVVIVAVVVLVLEGLDGMLPQALMLFLWWAAALGVGLATDRIERYLARRRRLLG